MLLIISPGKLVHKLALFSESTNHILQDLSRIPCANHSVANFSLTTPSNTNSAITKLIHSAL